MNYYAYRLMIRANEDNKLRSEEYIHLRDAIIGNVDSTNDINNIGTAHIHPSSYIDSPRHLQEYIQDAMTYVRPNRSFYHNYV